MSVTRAKMGLPLLLVVGLLAVTPAAYGGDNAPRRTFGTPLVSHTVQAFAFGPFIASYAAAVSANASGSRFCTIPCDFEAAVQLPAGALVQSIELAACDTSATASVRTAFFRVPAPEGAAEVLASTETGDAPTPGCTFRSVALTPPHTIDNFNNTYVAQVSVTGSDSTTRFQAVRVFYTLQISPPPAVATFGDVPTGHPFFPFVEALVAAGITGGCSTSPPLYCPDNPVTRAQMAAFISRALGLQFAP